MTALEPICERMRRKKPMREKSATCFGSSSRVAFGQELPWSNAIGSV